MSASDSPRRAPRKPRKRARETAEHRDSRERVVDAVRLVLGKCALYDRSEEYAPATSRLRVYAEKVYAEPTPKLSRD